VGRDIPKPITLFFLYTRNRPVYSVSVVVVNRRIPQVISSKKNCSSHGTPRVRLRRHGLRWFARGRQSSRLIRGTDTRTHAELEGIVSSSITRAYQMHLMHFIFQSSGTAYCIEYQQIRRTGAQLARPVVRSCPRTRYTCKN
jgi:hypothetical protein